MFTNDLSRLNYNILTYQDFCKVVWSRIIRISTKVKMNLSYNIKYYKIPIIIFLTLLDFPKCLPTNTTITPGVTALDGCAWNSLGVERETELQASTPHVRTLPPRTHPLPYTDECCLITLIWHSTTYLD